MLHLRRLLIGFSLLLLSGLLITTPGLLRADPSRRPTLSDHAAAQADAYDPTHVLVQLRAGAHPTDLTDQALVELFADWYRAPVHAGETAPAAVERLKRHPAVLNAELDVLLQVTQTAPNDPLFPFQWNLTAINAPQAWEQSVGAGVTVAVLDTGLRQGPDLTCLTLVAPFNVLTGASGVEAVRDGNGHGTHVAGTIAQCTNNGAGVAGVAPGATLMPVAVCDAGGGCALSAIAEGISWAIANDAQVINMSLGANCGGVGDGNWPNCSSALVNTAIDAAVAADIVLVAASGNAGQSVVAFPANHPEVIAVGAVDATLARTSYSNYGTTLDLIAPGGDVLRDANGDGLDDGILQETLGQLCGTPETFAFCSLQGTSMASPHVAGAAAILRSAAPTANRTAIRNVLALSAQDLGDPGVDPFYGSGLIDLPAALAALGSSENPPTPTPIPGGVELAPALYIPFVAQ